MSDLVERLRKENSMPPYYGPPKIQVDAAARIERLEAALREIKEALFTQSCTCSFAVDEIIARAALEDRT